MIFFLIALHNISLQPLSLKKQVLPTLTLHVSMKCNPETDGIYTARNYTTAIQTKQVSAEAADISISERSSISERGQPGMPAHRRLYRERPEPVISLGV